MLVPADLSIGACSHTGLVRSSNQDDYLIVLPTADGAERGRLFVVADGMGGVAGGAEASRTAVRALATEFLADDGAPGGSVEALVGRMRRGFERACAEVFRSARQTPRLREMGTTMTAVALLGRQAVLAHVGDTRCLRVRGRGVERLTVDHAVGEPRNLLTRCIGAGQEAEEVDVRVVEVGAGDTMLLMSDGVWNSVAEERIPELVAESPPQRVAELLVELANRAGGTDNATVVVVRIDAQTPATSVREQVIPTEEAGPAVGKVAPATVPRWPWAVLALSAALGALATARLAFGIDLLRR